MADVDLPDPPTHPPVPVGLHVEAVSAWRGRFADPGRSGGDGLDAVVVEFRAVGGDVPPLIVPAAAVSHVARVLFEAARSETRPVATAEPPARIGGPQWARLLAEPRHRAADPSTIPASPGVYAWFRDGVPVYLGRAKSKRGLRARVGADQLAADTDVGRTGFRRAVAEHLGLPLHEPLDAAGLARTNDWIAACEVAWIACATSTEALELEAALRAEHDHDIAARAPGTRPT